MTVLYDLASFSCLASSFAAFSSRRWLSASARFLDRTCNNQPVHYFYCSALPFCALAD